MSSFSSIDVAIHTAIPGNGEFAADNVVTDSGVCNRMLCMGGRYHMHDQSCLHAHDVSHTMGWGFPDQVFDDSVV